MTAQLKKQIWRTELACLVNADIFLNFYTSELYEGKYIGIQNPFLIFFD